MGLPLLPDLDLDPDFALSQLESALSGADDGELYLEHTKARATCGGSSGRPTTKTAVLACARWPVN